MCSWQVVVPRWGPCAWPSIISAADAFAAVVVEHDRLLAVSDQPLVDDVEHLQERRLVADLGNDVGLEATRVVRAVLAPDLERDVRQVSHL
jgi:hypothetical protein